MKQLYPYCKVCGDSKMILLTTGGFIDCYCQEIEETITTMTKETPEQAKAKELVQESYEQIPEEVFETSVNYEILHEWCKKSAIKCVDKLISANPHTNPLNTKPVLSTMNFWIGVRKEIELI